jgi:hypothetical protein
VDVIISRERQTEKLRGEEPQLTGKKKQHKPKRKGVSQAEEKQKEQQRG